MSNITIKTRFTEPGVHRDRNNDGIPDCRLEKPSYQNYVPTSKAVNCPRCLAEIRVHTLRSGQLRPYADSYYSFQVLDLADTPRSKAEMLEILNKHVRKSYARDEMPHPFAGQRTEFRRDSKNPRLWHYSIRELYTG